MRAARRLPQLLLGVALFGLGIALMARSRLGLGSWSVLHEGLSRQTGLGLGTVDVLVSIPILLSWLPLKQVPGPGTLAAGFLLGLVTNLSMDLVASPASISLRILLLLAGSVSIALGSGLYLAADLGPGPRDGVMTGLHQRFGWSVRSVRAGLELSVLVIGYLLGGTVGVGTLVHALLIGPMVQVTLGWWDVSGSVMRRKHEGPVR